MKGSIIFNLLVNSIYLIGVILGLLVPGDSSGLMDVVLSWCISNTIVSYYIFIDYNNLFKRRKK